MPEAFLRLTLRPVTVVFRVDRYEAEPWVARVFPPARPAGGDAVILGFLERHDFSAERLAVDDAVSEFEGSSVLATRCIESRPFPDPTAKLGLLADFLGRLHALPLDDWIRRPGGDAAGSGPRRGGCPRQDLLAALAFLDAVDAMVATTERGQFEQLCERVRSADDGVGVPEALVHGNLLHVPDHALLTDAGPVEINWKGSGRGPRLSDPAWLLWETCRNAAAIDAIVDAYRQHVDLTGEELDLLEAMMCIRSLYLTCFGYLRNIVAGWDEDVLASSDPDYVTFTAAAACAAFRR